MKYLKKFLESENRNYIELTSEEYYGFLDEIPRTKRIPDYTTKKIQEIVPDNFKVISDLTSILITNNEPMWEDGIRIHMVLDEDWWFWVMVELEAANLYYKCDDVVGFSEMIEKEFNSLIPYDENT